MSDELDNLRRQVAELSASFNRLAGDRIVLSFKDFALEYLKRKLANPTLRAATKEAFENQVRKHLVPRFGALPIEKISNAEWLYWVTEEQAKPKGIRRFFNARKVLIEIMRAAREDGHIQKLPKFDNPDEKQDVGRILTQGEILKIIWYSRRPFRFIFYTFWKMGCRPREILRWEFSMIRWQNDGSAWIDIPARITKTGRKRSIPINSGVSPIIWTRYQQSNSHFVFPSRQTLDCPQLSYSSAWLRACARGKIIAQPYDLRRTFITKAAAEGKPLLYIAKLLDTSIAMVEGTYAKAQAQVLEDIVK